MSFTHNFEIQLNDDNLEGEIEFDTDGQLSYKFENDPTLGLTESEILNRLFATLKGLFDLNDSLIKVEINKKE